MNISLLSRTFACRALTTSTFKIANPRRAFAAKSAIKPSLHTNNPAHRWLGGVGGVGLALVANWQRIHAQGDEETGLETAETELVFPQLSLGTSNLFLATPVLDSACLDSASIAIQTSTSSSAPGATPAKPGLVQLVVYGAKMLAMGVVYALTGLVGSITGVVLMLSGKAGLTNQVVGRFFGNFASAFTGTTVQVIEGQEYLEQERPCVLLVNHQSGLDVFVMASICPRDAVIMAKNTLQWIPLVGLFMTVGQTIFVSRGKSTASATAALTKASRITSANKYALIMFPEGTRSYSSTPMLLPFKKGAFRLAIQDGIPLVPIVVENYVHIYDAKRHAWPGGNIRVKVLPPVSMQGKGEDDLDGVIDQVRESMQTTLEEMAADRKSRVDL